MRLPTRAEPYWRALDKGLHLGYRRRRQGGSWTARRRNADGRYEEEKLGLADDTQDADGILVLSFAQAQQAARERFRLETRREAGLEPQESGPYTVGTALDDYIAHYNRRGKSKAATSYAAEAHIRPTLGDVEVVRLTTQKIRAWLDDLANAPPRVRAPKTSNKIKHRKAATDHDAKRRRRATANRVLTVLKAALNHAWREGKAPLDSAWRRVKPFRDVDAATVRYLTAAESVRLVNATAEAFRPMVRGALLSGCRYGELAALRASDFNEDSGTLMIRTSKSGKPRHVILTKEGQRFFANVTAVKSGNDLIFTKPDGGPWGKSHQQRPLIDACKRAKITPAIGFHVLRHTHGSTLAMEGVPLPVIAKQLGHADSRMTEKHYAHLAPNYIADTIREAFPTLGIVPKSNVKQLRRKRKPAA